MGISLTQQFTQERQYLKAVSQKTLIWYGCSFKAFDGVLDSKDQIRQRIVELRNRGVSPITVNSYLRCINAYLKWLHVEHGAYSGEGERHSGLKVNAIPG